MAAVLAIVEYGKNIGNVHRRFAFSLDLFDSCVYLSTSHRRQDEYFVDAALSSESRRVMSIKQFDLRIAILHVSHP